MRTWLLKKLTQVSAWVGLFVIVSALIFPRTVEIFLGLLLLLNDDAWLQSKFSFLRGEIEKRWKE